MTIEVKVYIVSSNAVQAVCSWCVPTDLAWVGIDLNPGVGMVEMVSNVVGGPLAENLELAQQTSLYSPKAVSRGINSSTAICAVACKIIPRIRLCL